MAHVCSRRSLLASGAACLGAELLNNRGYASLLSAPNQANRIHLRAEMRTLEINGKTATLMGLQQANGRQGLSFVVNQLFDVLLENQLPVATAIHWHGLHSPNRDDGVPGLTQPVIAPNAGTSYRFPVQPAGTHWMHSHQGLQEAFLLSAPLIVHDPSEKPDEQEIILFLGDFSFTSPTAIFERLRKPAAKPMAMGKPDTNDVNYDAYLVNDRTLADPEIVRVENHGRVRLRIINGSSGTNFFVNLGDLKGELIATDGMPVAPLSGSRFPLAIAQRIDVRVQLLLRARFLSLRFVRAPRNRLASSSLPPGRQSKSSPLKMRSPAELLSLDLESRLVAAHPLTSRQADCSYDLRLQGNMSRYEWPINGIVFDTAHPSGQKAQVTVKRGQRVVLNFINETGMSHPMHLHGHSFQVVAINGKSLNGALRDTVLVPPKTKVTVAFDADNPGVWYLHCHILWHLAAGMATLVRYEA